jgi:hypothetical protein
MNCELRLGRLASRTEGSTGLFGLSGLHGSLHEALRLFVAGRDFWELPLGLASGRAQTCTCKTTKRSRAATTRFRAKRSDPPNPPNPHHPVEPSVLFASLSGFTACRHRDSSVISILSSKGLLRTVPYQFLASSSSPQRARPRRDRRPSGARCSTGGPSTDGAGSATTASPPRTGRSKTAR